MDESPAARKVWLHLEGLGCTRSVSQFRTNGVEETCVVIRRDGELIAFGHHALESVANSGALLEAMRRLEPSGRRPGVVSVHPRHS